MTKKIPLGKKPNSKVITAEPTSIEERMSTLEMQVRQLTEAINSMTNAITKKKYRNAIRNINEDGIPIGISLVGESKRNGIQMMTVNSDGYYIGIVKYDSLSAAAQAASGVRRSGWTYWKLTDGRTVKEAFGY
jgi:hypothetical protein